MKLKKLLENTSIGQIYGSLDVEVESIVDNSNNAKKKSLFVAIKGEHFDAHKFIPDVIKRGATVVVGEIEPKRQWLKKISYIKVSNARYALSQLASLWYGNPSKSLIIIGVTGTKGKTTVVHVLYWLLKKAGKKVGLVSSIAAVIDDKEFDTGLHVTSPEPLALQKFLSEMVKAKCEYAILEVTSHGLEQERVAGINFDVGILTNITHEHLDYHKTFEAYQEAKAKLFKSVNVAILNKDDKSFEYVKNKLPQTTQVISYALKNNADYVAKVIHSNEVMRFVIKIGKEKYNISSNLIGEYNALNILAAIAAARRFDISWDCIVENIINLPTLPGRLERIGNKRGVNIYIDFAHTPDSLEKVLELLRKKYNKGKLISIFGCAGERDVLKRPMMGEISARLADVSIFTAEDPRSEAVNKIIEKIVEGAKKTGAKEMKFVGFNNKVDENKHYFFRVPERREAIALAIQSLAQEKDTIVVCGKGHEKSMAYDGIEHPWSDKRAIEDALDARKDTAAIVLAAGLGTRMKSPLPKVLHKIAGRPLLAYTLQALRRAKIGKIVVVVGYRSDLVEERVGGAVAFAFQKNPKGGTAEAAQVGLRKIPKDVKDVLVLYADDTTFYRPETIEEVLKIHQRQKAVITFVTLTKEDPTGLGRVVRDRKGKLLAIVEEKDANNRQRRIKEVNDGLYVFDKSWLMKNIHLVEKSPISKEYYLVDLIKIAIKAQKKVETFKLKDKVQWYPVTTPENLKEADRKMRRILAESFR